MIAQHKMVGGGVRVWGLLDLKHKISFVEPLSRFDLRGGHSFLKISNM